MYSVRLLEELLRHRNSEIDCDISLRVGNRVEVKAHGCVLRAGSLFLEDCLRSNPSVIDILHTSLGTEFNASILERCLPEVVNTIYTGLLGFEADSHDLSVFQAFRLKHVVFNEQAMCVKVENVAKGVEDEEEDIFISLLDDLNNGEIQPHLGREEEIVATTTTMSNETVSSIVKKKIKKEVDIDVLFCGKCDLLFTSKEEFLNHQSGSCPHRFTCRTCGKSFSHVQILVTHFIENHSGDLSCCICSHVAQSQQDLEFHILKHGDPDDGTKPNEEAASASIKIPNDAKPSSIKKRLKKEVEMDVSFCSKCDLLFTSKEEFLSHRNSSCLRKFTCRTCGKMFPRVQMLVTHLIEIRHGELICSVCTYVAESQRDLEIHIQKHGDPPEKPFFCLQCDSRFANRNGLTHHLPKHSSETPYVCQICTRGFKWKHALTSHMITHSSEKKFLCQDCGYTTSHVSTFKSHMRVHTGNTIKCGQCSFQTTRKQNLVQHQLTHSKEKPHQCEVCGRAFSLAKNMRRHAQQHDKSAFQYVCKAVGCTFNTLRSDKYIEHVRRYHPEESEQLLQEKKAPNATTTSLNHIFELINPPNKTINTDTFVESAQVVSTLTIDSVLSPILS